VKSIPAAIGLLTNCLRKESPATRWSDTSAVLDSVKSAESSVVGRVRLAKAALCVYDWNAGETEGVPVEGRRNLVAITHYSGTEVVREGAV
jgi:hypothetical protein